jgi:copper(I)-binding protein
MKFMKRTANLLLWLLALVPLSAAYPADLCVDGLCVVRAQVSATHGLMTRYQPMYLTVENRTGRRLTVSDFSSEAAESVQLLSGDEWEPKVPRKLVVGPNEYRTLGASSEWRLMLVGLKQPLSRGQTIFLKMKMSSGRTLAVPMKVI